MSRKLDRRTILFGLGLLPSLMIGLLSCNRQPQTSNSQSPNSAQNVSSPANAPSKVTIAYQPGLAYYSLLLTKHQKTLEKQFPNTTIEWKALSTPTPIRDGLIANQIQVGAVGVPTFLLGWDQGLNWKLLAGLVQQDYWLVVNDPAVKSLKDIKPNHKIATTGPTGVQAVTLRMAAQKQLGNPKAFEANLQTMSHPLGLQALESKQVTAHFTAAPFQWQAVEKGAQAIVKSADLFGGLHTGIGLVTTETFYNQYPAFNQALYKAVDHASRLMREKPDEAATLLAAETEGKTTADQIKQWLTQKDIQFTTEPKGFLGYATFLKETNEIKKQPSSIDELVFPTLQGKGGN